MKIVINTKHGGYGLSNEALEMILQRKNIEYEIVEEGERWLRDILIYHKGHVGNNDYFIDCDEFERNDIDLVAVVEELGNKANDSFSCLKIVEIPDDVEWQIEEYDGKEWIAEKHRTWS